jgi:hypothetical protein
MVNFEFERPRMKLVDDVEIYVEETCYENGRC